jgi:predicted Zn-dependent protease
MKRAPSLAVMLAPIAVLAVFVAVRVLAGPLPGIDPKQMQQLQQGAQTVGQINKANQPWSNKEERATGRVLAARVAASFGGVWKNEAWTAYVNKIGRGLVPLSNRPDIKYRFAILNSEDVNAFSCPGGYIFVTKGLLKAVKNEAQLAGVLAHEIAHVSEKHIEKEVKQQKLAGIALEQGLNFAASEGQLKPEEVEAMKKIGDAGYEILVKKGYSREDEFEADRLAARTMFKMGYQPEALVEFVRSLGSNKTSQLQVLLSTHPAAEDRAKTIKEQIESKQWKTDGLALLADRLERMKTQNPLK